MATSTFERNICFKDPYAVNRLSRAMECDNAKINNIPTYTNEECNRSEELLKQLLSPSEKS